MDDRHFEGVLRFTGFDAASSELLAELHEHVAPEIQSIVADFYAAIDADPDVAGVISGEEQRARLRQSLVAWLGSSLTGPHDLAYLRSRERIGMVHVRIGLPQRYVLAAMNRVRAQLLARVERTYPADSEKRSAMSRAVHQLLDLELSIMLDSYHAYFAERVRNAERLATIGQLAATIGHELRNPLGIIESSMFLLKQRLVRLQLEDPQVEKHHDRVQKQVQHCSKVITNLLDLARDRPPRRRREDAEALVRHVLEELDLGPTVDVEISRGLTLDVDADDFGHLLTNLVSNASDAMNGSGRITISAARRGGGTDVFVQDDGPGIPKELRDRVFDALFTTKSRGTGLGLALCRRILYAHGGELQLEPTQRGARFRMWFPDAAEETPTNG